MASGSVLSRESVNGIWDPDDMTEMFRMFGGTERGHEVLANTQNRRHVRLLVNQTAKPADGRNVRQQLQQVIVVGRC